ASTSSAIPCTSTCDCPSRRSFPTRRSSDLVDERLLHHPGRQRDQLQDPHLHPPLARAAAAATRGGGNRARPTDGRWAGCPGRRQRGSAAVSFWKSLLGKSEPKRANLDALFSLPSAAITLQASLGFTPTGVGSVCFRAAEGAAFAGTRAEVTALLRADGTHVTEDTDEYGYTWLTDRHEPSDLTGLVTELHGVNSTLEAHGFGPGLLCSLVHFR